VNVRPHGHSHGDPNMPLIGVDLDGTVHQPAFGGSLEVVGAER